MVIFDPSVSRVTGPLPGYVAGFAAELTTQGYAACSVRRQLGLMAQLSAWLADQGLGAGQLSPLTAGRFAAVMRYTASRCCRHVAWTRSAGVSAHLECGAGRRDAGGAREVLLEGYQQYLRHERGVCEWTVFLYTPFEAAFLAQLGDPLPQALSNQTGAGVLGIVTDQLRPMQRGRR
jgi:hypothetical protein